MKSLTIKGNPLLGGTKGGHWEEAEGTIGTGREAVPSQEVQGILPLPCCQTLRFVLHHAVIDAAMRAGAREAATIYSSGNTDGDERLDAAPRERRVLTGDRQESQIM